MFSRPTNLYCHAACLPHSFIPSQSGRSRLTKTPPILYHWTYYESKRMYNCVAANLLTCLRHWPYSRWFALDDSSCSQSITWFWINYNETNRMLIGASYEQTEYNESMHPIYCWSSYVYNTITIKHDCIAACRDHPITRQYNRVPWRLLTFHLPNKPDYELSSDLRPCCDSFSSVFSLMTGALSWFLTADKLIINCQQQWSVHLCYMWNVFSLGRPLPNWWRRHKTNNLYIEMFLSLQQ